MAYWLLKTEPSTYSYEDLIRDKKTVWDGITNNLALKHIRTIHKGDLAFIYHSGNEKQIVGIGEIISEPYPDPKQKDSKLVIFDIKPTNKLKQCVTLKEIKTDKRFKDFGLVRMSRLSVVPVTEIQWKNLMKKGNVE